LAVWSIFVAVLGASNFIYAEARWSEALPDWIGVHVNAFTAIGGVPNAVVCDNLKAGVTATCRYEPGINRTYQDLATHSDTAILPARPRKPRDKAKVEVGVAPIGVGTPGRFTPRAGPACRRQRISRRVPGRFSDRTRLLVALADAMARTADTNCAQSSGCPKCRLRTFPAWE
jgi:hypothetical protein